MQTVTIPSAVAPFVRAGHADLSCRHVATLALIVAQPGISVREIAAALDVPKPAVTRALDALADEGLITRTTPASDRRLVSLHPTPRGVELLSQILGEIAEDVR